MKLPIKIDPCPIKECVFEIRYSSKYPADAIFGIVYSAITMLFGNANAQALPIVQIPEALRAKDPNLKYQPLHVLTKDNLNLRIGPRSITFGNAEPYVGWEEWSTFFDNILSKIRETRTIDKVERIGLRYINVFDAQIFDKIKLKIDIADRSLLDEPTNIRTEIVDEELIKILQVANNSQITIGTESRSGSVIDIDCIYNISEDSDEFFETYNDLVGKAHLKEKELFFSLLQESFLKTLNPVYEEE